MSFGEISHRLKNKYKALSEQVGFGVARRAPAPDYFREGAKWFNGTRKVDAAKYLRAADVLLNGRLKVFSLSEADIGQIPDWNRDPRTGIHAPLVFGKTLNYRDEKIVGDIKYLWEPNRHLQLVWLCQSYRLSGDEKYLLAFRRQMESWFQQCPYLLGPNWTSSLELGIRLINWAICWELIGRNTSKLFEGEVGNKFRRDWLTSIYQHSHFISGHWSRYSSANNHLIGEASGLYIASVTWPYWPVSHRWQKSSRDILEKEYRLQTYPDGVNREQAISYQQFVLDFLLLAGLAGRAAGENFSDEYWQNIERMLDFVASLMDCAGNVPMIGDADDGYVVSLSKELEFCPFRSLLATGAVLFSRPEFLKKAGRVDDKTRWLLGDDIEETSSNEWGNAVLPVRADFPDGGYYIIGSDFETENEIRMIMDTGPLGYLSIAAHGHADALSVYLSVGGKEFLIDPGTYAYHTQKVWRDYFRGTAAHNTVSVDGLDQSESGGNFMWLRHANVGNIKWSQSENAVELSARHDGYTRLTDPVVHRRFLCYYPATRNFVIEDRIECKGEHDVKRWWHFSEECVLSEEEDHINVSNNGRSIRLSFEGQPSAEKYMYRGSEQPLGGWVSRSFDKRKPATSLVEHFHIIGSVTIIARIECLYKQV